MMPWVCRASSRCRDKTYSIPTPLCREDLGLPLNINQSFLPHVTMPPTLTEGQMMSP